MNKVKSNEPIIRMILNEENIPDPATLDRVKKAFGMIIESDVELATNLYTGIYKRLHDKSPKPRK